jgi:hypothetical protein
VHRLHDRHGDKDIRMNEHQRFRVVAGGQASYIQIFGTYSNCFCVYTEIRVGKVFIVLHIFSKSISISFRFGISLF